MQKITVFVILLTLSFTYISCEKNTDPLDDDNVIDYSAITDISYTEHVQSLFDSKCISCHGEQQAETGLKVDSWENLIKGSDFGEAFIPFDSENSLMIEMMTKLVGTKHPADAGSDVLEMDAVDFLSRWIDEGARNENDEVPYQASANRVYVCNQDAGIVSVIDTDAKVVIRNINLTGLGYSETPKPHDVTVGPDGSFWYVSLIGDGKVLKFDTDYNLIGEANFESAGLLAMHPTKDLLYVGHTLSKEDVLPTIGVITRSSMSLVPISLFFTRPHALIADHDGRYVYVASLVDYLFAVIDTDTDPENVAYPGFIPGGKKNLIQMNISPDDQTIYVSSQLSEELMILDVSDPENVTLQDSVTVGAQPWHPKHTPDGNHVYVGNNVSHTVSVVNTSSNTVETTIGSGDGTDGLAEPHGLVISPDGSFVYVTGRNKNTIPEYIPRYDLGDNANSGTVTIIRTSDNTIFKVLEIEQFPSGITIYNQ